MSLLFICEVSNANDGPMRQINQGLVFSCLSIFDLAMISLRDGFFWLFMILQKSRNYF